MNAFDEEMGPILPQEDAEQLAERLRIAAGAGLSLDELRAWERAKGTVN